MSFNDPNILTLLFSFLSPNGYSPAINSCVLVNKLWRSKCLAEYSWFPVYETAFQSKYHGEKDGTVVLTLQNLVLHIPREPLRFSEGLIKKVETSKPGYPDLSATFDLREDILFKQLLLDYLSFLGSEERKNLGLWRNYAIFTNKNFDLDLKVSCQINIAQMKKMIASGHIFGGKSFLWKCVASSNNTFPEIAYDDLRNPSIPPAEQPKGFPDGFFMSPNQLRTLSWLLSIEKSTPKITTYKDVICWRTVHGNLFFDTNAKKIVSPSDLSQYEKSVVIPKGGVLEGDDILGRKVEMVALILSNLKQSSVSGELRSVINNKIYTSATLVICSVKEDLEKWRSTFSDISKLKVLTFECFDDLSPFTQQNIVDSDVVIVLLQFARKTDIVRTSHKPNEPVVPPPTLDTFFWRRVILCESHKYLQSISIFFMTIKKLTTAHMWCISPTPLAPSQVLSTTMQVLGFPPQCMAEFISKFIWKNYKNDTKNSETVFVHEEIVIDPKPGVEFYSAIRFAALPSDMPLDEDKFRLIVELREKIAHKLETLRVNPNFGITELATDIYLHELLWNTPDLYKGPPLEENFMSHLSDANLAPFIQAKNDINEKEDVLRGACPKYSKYVFVDKTPNNPPNRKIEETEKKPDPPKKDKEKKSLFSIFSGKKKETKESEKDMKSTPKEQERDPEGVKKEIQGDTKENNQTEKDEKSKEKDEKTKEKDEKSKEMKIESREIPKGMLEYLTNIYGSKKTALFVRLKEIWEKDPSARVLVITEGPINVLKFLEKMGIAAGIITDLITVYRFAGERLPVWTSNLKNPAPLRVFLYDKVDSNMHFQCSSFAVSHIFFLNVLAKNQEHRIVAAAHPQGNRKVIHFVRIFWRDSVEHETLLKDKDTTTPAKKIEIPKPIVPPESEVAKIISKSGVPSDKIRSFVSLT